MHFYDCSTAPSPRRARVFIAEKGLEIPTTDISIAEGEQMSDEFRKINPHCTLPALVTDDGVTLTQNIGIATYLEAKHPEPVLMGRTPAETGEIIWADEGREETKSVKVRVGGFGGGVEDDAMFDRVLKPVVQQLVASLKASF